MPEEKGTHAVASGQGATSDMPDAAESDTAKSDAAKSHASKAPAHDPTAEGRPRQVKPDGR